MADKKELFRLPDGTIAYLEMNSIQKILADKGLAVGGDVQTFHTQNALRRIGRYMPYRSGMTIKVMVAQTNIKNPEIILDTPYAKLLHRGVTRKGTPLHYTTNKNPLAGPFWERRLSEAEGAAMAADLQRFIKAKG